MLQLVKRLSDATYGIKDLDTTKGIVTGYFAAFNIKDSDGDIIRPGAFAATLALNGPTAKRPRIKHCQDHRRDMVVGVLQSLIEDTYGLKYESKIGRDTKSRDYLLMCEDGYITEHSIGYNTVRGEYDQSLDAYSMVELKLYEGSGLQFWGANPETPLLGIKADSLTSAEDVVAVLKMLEKSWYSAKYSDETFKTVIQPSIEAYNLALKSFQDKLPIEEKGDDSLTFPEGFVSNLLSFTIN